jgi:hypothetical protein
MVFVEDREGLMDASIDGVWELVRAHGTDCSGIHPHVKDVMTKRLNNSTFTNTWLHHIDGQTIEIEIKATMFYPLGVAFEILKGPFVRSTYFVYYVPIQDENKTNAIVVGDFQCPYIKDTDILTDIILLNLQSVFDEDVLYLKNMK